MIARKTTVESVTHDDALPVNESRSIPRMELSARASRAGGAGGQHVNTSSTRVEVLWNPASTSAFTPDEKLLLLSKLAARLDSEGNVRVVASDTRSQKQNKDLAESRLAELVRRALLVPTKRKATRPSHASKERRLDTKKRESKKKNDRRSTHWE